MYDEIVAEINRLKTERSNCKAFQGAIGDIVDELSDIKYSLNLTASTLGLGAFNIDGKAIDIYSFGGFKKYASETIQPLISSLGGISSQIGLLVVEYNKTISALETKLDELSDASDDDSSKKSTNDDADDLKKEMFALKKRVQSK